MNDNLAEAARAAITAMAAWCLEWHPAYVALSAALSEHDDWVVDEAKAVMQGQEVM